jgi:CO/xanthine dehydrogenase Mo-binding subunit
MGKEKIVGKNIERFDAKSKVLGTAIYADDMPLSDFLYGAQVGSPVVRGILKKVIKDPDFDWTGFTFVDYKDITGKNEVESVVWDMPFLVESEIRYPGQPIILLAHKNREILEEGVKHISFDIEKLEHITTIDESLSKKVIVARKDNVFRTKLLHRGDLDEGFAKADFVFENTYYTPHQEQAYIEPFAMTARWEEDKVFIKGTMQCPYYIHGGLKVLFNKKDDQVIIAQSAVGGAFGGKEDYPTVISGHAALLSLKSGKTVKIIYDRDLDVKITTKRHPSKSVVKIGVTKEGKITALDMDFILDGGAYETMSSVILARGMLHAFGPYELDNVRVNGVIVATNTPPNGAFRGFGAPQSFFAIESQMDLIAKELNITPINFRKMNFVKKNGTFPTGQLLGEDVLMTEVFEQMLKNANHENLVKEIAEFNSNNKTKKRGFGFSTFFHGAGFTGNGEVMVASKAGVRLQKDGKLFVLVANTEMGQGAHTVLPQIVAESLGVSMDLVRTEKVDTSLVPNSGPTVASRTTMIVGEILRRVGKTIKEKIGFENESDYLEKVKSYLDGKEFENFYEVYNKPPKIVWDDENYRGDAYGTYAWGTYGVLAEVDTLSYDVRLIDAWSVFDIGKVINPLLATGQVEGGMVQSFGYALTENIVFDKAGKFWNADFTNYIIPSIMDVPNMYVDFYNREYEFGPYGAKGLGELPMDGGAPAVNNAIRNAIGVDLFNLPLSPEQIMNTIESDEV